MCWSIFLVLFCTYCVNTGVAFSVIPHHEAESVNLSTCAQYNVYYPRSCIGNECHLAVKWEEEDEDWVRFTLMAKTQGSAVWAGVGFSENGRMADSDVVACFYNNDKYKVYNAWNTDTLHNCDIDKNQDIVKFHYGNYSDGLLTCNFSRQKLSNDTKYDKSLLKTWHVLLAWGVLGTSNGVTESKMSQHAEQYSTECTCNVTNCTELCLCIDQFKHLLLKLHGTILSIVFILILPTATLIGRYYRLVLPNNWFQTHMIMMITGAIGMLSGLGFVLGHTGGDFSVGPHQIIGIITIGLAVTQVVIAAFRPHKGPSLQRKLFEIFHRLNATAILTLGTVAMMLGAWLLHSDHRTLLIWMEVIISMSVLCSVTLGIVNQFLSRFKYCKVNSPPVHYHKVSPEDSNSDKEVDLKDIENDNTSVYSKERTLLLIFILQSFTFSGLVTAFTFYDTTHKT